MIYLSGAIRPELPSLGIGYMLTPQMGNNPDLSVVHWAADNGCYAHPERFSLARYLSWLSRRPRHTCLFATAPDVVGDAAETWARSRLVLPMLRDRGFPAALVAQDGIEQPDWHLFDVLFVGGSTEWKLSSSAEKLVYEAKIRNKWVHIGRVNSYRRLRYFDDMGADSADGTFLCFGPDRNIKRLTRWLKSLEIQRPLCAK